MPSTGPSGDTPSAATGTPVGLSLTDKEIIDLISEKASQDAAVMAREKVNFFLTLLGISAALVAAVAAAWFNTQVDERVKAASTEIEARLNTTLTTSVDAQMATASAELKGDVQSVIKLSLLVSEAIIFDTGKGYSAEDADRVIQILDGLKAEILALEGDIKTLAYRRIEGIMDSFINAGDYGRAFQVFDIFGSEFEMSEGIYATLAIASFSYILIDPENSKRIQHVIETLRAMQLSPRSNIYNYQRMLMIAHDANEGQWNAQFLVPAIQRENERSEDFALLMHYQIQSLEQEIQKGAINHSAAALERHGIAFSAVSLVAGFDQ